MNFLCIDNHQIILDSLERLIRQSFNNAIVKQFTIVNDAIWCITHHHFDLAICDIHTEDGKNLEIPKICKDLNIPCMVYTGFSNRVFIEESEKHGVYSFVCKSSPTASVVQGIQACINKEHFYCNHIQKRLSQEYVSYQRPEKPILTETEIELMRLYSKGFDNIGIANKLNKSYHTIRTHRNNMLHKNNCTYEQLLYAFHEWYT